MSWENAVYTTVRTAFNASATSIKLHNAPTPMLNPPSNGKMILTDGFETGDKTKFEIITYTGVTDHLSYIELTGVTRGAEGTTANTWAEDDLCYQNMTAADMEKLDRIKIHSDSPADSLDISSDGIITLPYLPIASYSHSSSMSISNGSGLLTSSNFYDKEYVNRGSHFSPSTGKFTCPVDGIYRLYFRQSGNNCNVRLQKNGVTINECYDNSTVGNLSVSSEIVVECDAGDWLALQAHQLNTIGGTQHKQVTFQLLG